MHAAQRTLGQLQEKVRHEPHSPVLRDCWRHLRLCWHVSIQNGTLESKIASSMDTIERLQADKHKQSACQGRLARRIASLEGQKQALL